MNLYSIFILILIFAIPGAQAKWPREVCGATRLGAANYVFGKYDKLTDDQIKKEQCRSGDPRFEGESRTERCMENLFELRDLAYQYKMEKAAYCDIQAKLSEQCSKQGGDQKLCLKSESEISAEAKVSSEKLAGILTKAEEVLERIDDLHRLSIVKTRQNQKYIELALLQLRAGNRPSLNEGPAADPKEGHRRRKPANQAPQVDPVAVTPAPTTVLVPVVDGRARNTKLLTTPEARRSQSSGISDSSLESDSAKRELYIKQLAATMQGRAVLEEYAREAPEIIRRAEIEQKQIREISAETEIKRETHSQAVSQLAEIGETIETSLGKFGALAKDEKWLGLAGSQRAENQREIEVLAKKESKLNSEEGASNSEQEIATPPSSQVQKGPSGTSEKEEAVNTQDDEAILADSALSKNLGFLTDTDDRAFEKLKKKYGRARSKKMNGDSSKFYVKELIEMAGDESTAQNEAMQSDFTNSFFTRSPGSLSINNPIKTEMENQLSELGREQGILGEESGSLFHRINLAYARNAKGRLGKAKP